ncbi:MAG: AsmA family protein, partial [Desulfobacterales bacterium]
ILLVAAKLFISPERIRRTVVPLAEKSLDRKVEIGDIRIRLFSGVSIENLQVRMREGDARFVSAESLVLRYQLLPLLKKQVVIDEVLLKNPTIHVIRNADGSFNFSDLLKNKQETAAAAEKPDLAQAGKGPAVNLLVSTVKISDGQLEFTDRTVGAEPFEYRASGLMGSAKDISLEKAFAFDMTARLNDADFSVSGTFNTASGKIQANAELKELSAVDFAPYFRQHLPGRLSSADLDVDASITGDARAMDSAGSIRASRINMELDALPDAPVRNAQCRLEYDLSANLAEEEIQIRRADMDINGIAVSASGDVLQYASAPRLDIALTLPETGVREIVSAVPENLVSEVARMDPAGTVAADVRIAGSVDQPKALIKNGKIRLDRVQASAGGLRPSAIGAVNLSAEKIFANGLQVKLGEDTVSVDAEVTKFFSAPVHVTHRAHAGHLDLDALIAAAGQDKGGAQDPGADKSGGREKTPAANEVGPFDLPLRVDGSIEADRARYRDLPITDLLIHYRLADNVLTVDRMSAKLAQGQAKGDARVDLAQKGLDYDVNLDLAGIQSGPVASAFYRKAAGMFSGTADIQGRIRGRGVSMADIRKNLNGQTDFRISDGRIDSPALAGGLADTLGIKRLDALDFDVFRGNLRIESGKIRINGDYDSNDVKMKPTGTIGLDGSLGIDLNLTLAPDLSTRLPKDSPVARLMADKQGWTQIPVRVSGDVSGPRFSLDRSRLQDQLKQKATEKVLEKAIEKLFD